MRAVVITKHGGFDVLKVEERPEPERGPGQTKIAVKAAGVNFADTMARIGLYPDAPKPPCVVGYEVAGEVVECDGLEPGTRVMAGTRFGGYADTVVVPHADVVPIPDSLSFEEAAAIPVNYSTAWAGLVGYGSLRPGEQVLLLAAAGGVGIAATQIAKRHGAVVHGVASAGKHERIRALGVDHAYGYDDDLPGPFDLIMDAVGGASARRSYDLLRPGGRLVAFGASSVVSGEKRNLLKAAPQALRMWRGFDLMDQMSTSKTVIGLNMLTLWDDRGTLDPWVQPLQALIEDGTIRPVVAAAIPFDDAGEAHRMLSERRNVGKVVLVP